MILKKIIIAVVVYDRFDNVVEWIRCFKMCLPLGELIIIHNYKNEEDKIKYSEYCFDNGIRYVSRINVGYDIGTFQDVCRERLDGFPNDWDYLFWAPDDAILMDRNFVQHYIKAFDDPEIGVVCLEISDEWQRHIRTTSFMVTKEVAIKLEFDEDPIVNRHICWAFEHRGDIFLHQVTRMWKKAVQVHPVLNESYLWDTGHRSFMNRWDEHYKEFPI